MRDFLPQRVPVDQLHDQVRAAVLHPGVEHGDQPGVFEAGQQPGLLVEPALPGAVRVGPENLDRHHPLQPGVQAPVHYGHPAGAQRRAQPVPPAQHDLRWLGWFGGNRVDLARHLRSVLSVYTAARCPVPPRMTAGMATYH
ncbi:hypothetical protein GTS_39500 [Gandjariella thermophila]|uniref:Uncharacterized protein n=1 Tax=Gandjariella thermophila TaxID=1931992 RepID=A0A4D4JEH8_9PSEU|nr:hypothetical protein GTS_39500 [Gandjariella thermophila]